MFIYIYIYVHKFAYILTARPKWFISMGYKY